MTLHPALAIHLLLLIASTLAGGCGAPDPARRVNPLMPPGAGFVARTLVTDEASNRYRVFIPRHYTPRRTFPVIVFLHGLGERGRDGIRPTTVGIGPAIAVQHRTFDFIVIFPQRPGNWKGAAGAQLVIDVLDDVRRHYAIDDDRVYLTGLSTGGEGAWRIGARHRDRFAALVPVCAYGAPDVSERLTTIPIWAFHNARDLVIPARATRAMVQAINSRGGDVRYTEFDSLFHNCWDAAYSEPELYAWLRRQHRRRR